MSQDLNRVMLIGTMATDPTQRMSGTTAVCNFRLVTNFGYRDKQKSEFINIVVWDKLAERVGTFLSKGARIYLDGRLQTREWIAVDGVKKQTVEVVADQIIFLDKKDAPARSTQSITNLTGDATEMFVLENMEKNV